MKQKLKLSLACLILMALIFGLPGHVYAQGTDQNGGKVVFGGTFALKEGETLNGDLVIIGGTATLDKGSQVNGDVAITGGNVEISGDIEGSVASIGGSLKINETAVIKGDLTSIGGTVSRHPGAQIKGQVDLGSPGSFNLQIPNQILNPGNLGQGVVSKVLAPFGKILITTIQSIMLALLAMLTALFLPNPTDRVVRTLSDQPLLSGGVGLLTLIVAPALILILAITIILLPLGLIGILVTLIALLFGWIAVGMEVGKRLAVMLKQDWASPVSAGLGTLIVSLVAFFFSYVWCIGWLAPFALSVIGLGAVVISRFGTQVYLPTQTPPPAIVSQPSPPDAPSVEKSSASQETHDESLPPE